MHYEIKQEGFVNRSDGIFDQEAVIATYQLVLKISSVVAIFCKRIMSFCLISKCIGLTGLLLNPMYC